MKKVWLRCVGAFIGILLLILDAKTSLAGAQEAITLCLQNVIPSLFPFLVLACYLTPALSGLNLPFSRNLCKKLGIPLGCEGIFLTGLIGGYPVGAQMIAGAFDRGQLNRQDAWRMLAFCSNCGPAFLFGILGMKFHRMWMLWALWGIHIVSAILVALLLPGKSNQQSKPTPAKAISLTEALKSGVKTIGYICGWVVLFRIAIAFLDRWVLWLLPAQFRVAVYGILELTNGCCSLETVSNTGLRFILAAGMLAFGGICVVMQTISVTGKLGLGRYLPGKLLQAFISIVLSYFIQCILLSNDERVILSPPIYLLLICAFVLFLIPAHSKGKIRGGNPLKIDV